MYLICPNASRYRIIVSLFIEFYKAIRILRDAAYSLGKP